MKLNYKPTSKKCSILNSARVVAIGLIAGLVLLGSTNSFAIPIEQDLKKFSVSHNTEFQPLIAQWEKKYGKKAIPDLLKVAKNKKAKDTDRFIAIMAITKISGTSGAHQIIPFIKDKNWMVRSAALKSIEILDYKPGSKHVLKLLKDPALVIRAQAVSTIETLKPEGSTEALLSAVYDPKNYRTGNYKKGKADWVPQRALAVLRKLRPIGVSAKLLPLMNDAHDRKLRAHALYTIETLEGKSLKKGSAFAERSLAWNQALRTTVRQ